MDTLKKAEEGTTEARRTRRNDENYLGAKTLMARRIAVVLSQSPTSGPQRHQVEEDLIAQLLLEAGIDVNVIPHLAHLESHGTGLLCLEGIKGDMVLACWLEPVEAHELLRSKQILGRMGRTAFDTSPPASAEIGRAIYYVDLNHFSVMQPVIREIQRIRDDHSVQTVNLIGVAGAKVDLGSSPKPPATSPAPTRTLAPPAIHASELDDNVVENSAADEALEQLVNQLDKLDL